MYRNSLLQAKRRLGIRYEQPKKMEAGRYITQYGHRDYKTETDDVIDYAIRDITYYGVLSRSLLNESVPVALYDISILMKFLYYWKDIMRDIGYDPRDSASIPLKPKDEKDPEYKSYEGKTDYNGFWLTHATHVRREMYHYVKKLKKPRGSVVDKVALRFIHDEMQLFREFGIPFPSIEHEGEVFDFECEFWRL